MIVGLGRLHKANCQTYILRWSYKLLSNSCFKVNPDADGKVLLNGDVIVDGTALPDVIESVEAIVISVESQDSSPSLISNLYVEACYKPSKYFVFLKLLN